jgi:hypothetical protein
MTGMTTIALLSDAQLTFYIESQEALAMRRVGIKFYDTTVTEHYDGDGSKWLALKHFPLRAVNTLSILGLDTDASCYHVYYDKAMIYMRDGKWSEGVHNITINYTYGAPSTEDAERFALAKSIVFKSVCKDVLLQRGIDDSSGVESEKLEQYSITYGKGPFSLTIAQLDKDIEEAYKVLGVTVEAGIF